MDWGQRCCWFDWSVGFLTLHINAARAALSHSSTVQTWSLGQTHQIRSNNLLNVNTYLVFCHTKGTIIFKLTSLDETFFHYELQIKQSVELCGGYWGVKCFQIQFIKKGLLNCKYRLAFLNKSRKIWFCNAKDCSYINNLKLFIFFIYFKSCLEVLLPAWQLMFSGSNQVVLWF